MHMRSKLNLLINGGITVAAIALMEAPMTLVLAASTRLSMPRIVQHRYCRRHPDKEQNRSSDRPRMPTERLRCLAVFNQGLRDMAQNSS